ncbi:MAG: hypothetical protein ACOYOE_03420 [Chlorobium sp.]
MTIAIDNLDAFIHRWTARSEKSHGGYSGDYIITPEGLVRNNMDEESGRGGYYHFRASTSESQVMMARGYLKAYQATKNIQYLTMARTIADALIKYFFFGVIPSANAKWHSHWVVNGGAAFNSKEKDHESELIAYGEAYECWPMWRKLRPNEFATAGDSLHWFMETFDLFYLLDTTSKVRNQWLIAKKSMFREFQMISRSPNNIGYKGAIPFELGNKNANPPSQGGGGFVGPYYAGYQNPIPWHFMKDYTAAANMLRFLIDAQGAYRTSTGIMGPFAPVFHYDSSMLSGATINKFSWKGPDPNTFWGGFQYRPFAAVANFWQQCITSKTNNQAVSSAATISTAFLTWLDTWLTEHPTEKNIPVTFHEGAAPIADYKEPHIIALALKGSLYCKKAGANPQIVTRVTGRLYNMLMSYQVTKGDMAGSYAPDPTRHSFNGFWAGEIMDALALYAIG